MYKWIFIAFSLLLVSCGGWKHSTLFTYEELSVSDFNNKLKLSSDYILIDVRTAGEYAKGHIENAVNISYFGSDFREKTEKLPKDKLVFMYCQTQHRSPLASKLMKKQGFNHIIDLKGGFIKWDKLKLPIVK